VLAVPGTKFTFAGKLTHLDLRSGVLALENASDGKLYEVKFKPTPQVVTDDLVIGAEVSIVALFSGRDYIAESLAVTSSAQARPSEDELK
jgi:hypothetical protein